jgi:hypothetical protein
LDGWDWSRDYLLFAFCATAPSLWADKEARDSCDIYDARFSGDVIFFSIHFQASAHNITLHQVIQNFNFITNQLHQATRDLHPAQSRHLSKSKPELSPPY